MYLSFLKFSFLLSILAIAAVEAQGCGENGCLDGILESLNPLSNGDRVDCYVDENDTDYIEIEMIVCPCDDGGYITASMEYGSNLPDGALRKEMATALNSVDAPASVLQTVTLSFDVPYTDLALGVFANFYEGYVGTSTQSEVQYQYTPYSLSTIFYVNATSTITQTVPTETSMAYNKGLRYGSLLISS